MVKSVPRLNGAKPRDILRSGSTVVNFEGGRVPLPSTPAVLSMTLFSERARIDERNDAVDARQKGGLHKSPRPRTGFSLGDATLHPRRPARQRRETRRTFLSTPLSPCRGSRSALTRRTARRERRSFKLILDRLVSVFLFFWLFFYLFISVSQRHSARFSG